MANSFNPLALSQQSMMKAAQDVSMKMLDGMTKLVQLNIETTRAMITDATDKASSTVETTGKLPDAQGLAAAVRPSNQEVGVYMKRVMDIVTETNVDLVAVMQKHALSFGPDAFAAAAKNGLSTGNDATMGALPNPFTATQDAMRQASETFTEAAKSMMQPKRGSSAAA